MADKDKKKVTRNAGNQTGDEMSEFEKLEWEFEQILSELLGDENLEKFRGEYEKLHEALVASHQSERKLMNKVRELNAELEANADKVAAAIRISEEDQSTIATLKKEVEKAWKIVEYDQRKELIARDTIQALKEEIDNLTALVEQGASLSTDATKKASRAGVAGLVAVPEPQAVPAGRGEDHVAVVRMTPEEMSRQAEDKEAIEEAKLALYKAEADLRNKTAELTRERGRYTKLAKDLHESQAALDKAKGECEELRGKLEEARFRLERAEDTSRDQAACIDRLRKDNEVLNTKIQRIQAEIQKQLGSIQQLTEDNANLTQNMRSVEDRANKMYENVKNLTKLKDDFSRKAKKLMEVRLQLKKEKEALRTQLLLRNREEDNTHKELDAANIRISILTREKELIHTNYTKQVKATEKQIGLVQLQEQSNRTLSSEIIRFRHESEKQRHIISQLEMERDNYITQNNKLEQRIIKFMEDVQYRDQRIRDHQKRIDELETRMEVQENLYEAVHADRNTYSFKLVETKDEMAEMKSKLLVLEHQGQQLKEEVANRETAVTKEKMERARVEKERDAASREVQSLKKQLRDAGGAIQDLKNTEHKMVKMLSAADEECRTQRRQLDKVVSERDVLGSQLVRRNDEVWLLYEKIRLLTVFMGRGYASYQHRIEDMRLLRLEVKRLRHDKMCLEKNVSAVQDYKQELYQCHRQLLHERTRCTALENELSHPRRVHRWRGLEISDPSRFELLQKVQALQKKLISRTEEVAEVERVLQEKDRLYLELRALLERHPGPEVVKQVAVYQRVLRNKNRQLKVLAAEVNMLETEGKLQQYDVSKMEKEVCEMKKKYFKQKKRRQVPVVVPTDVVTTPRAQFTGGGFKLTI